MGHHGRAMAATSRATDDRWERLKEEHRANLAALGDEPTVRQPYSPRQVVALAGSSTLFWLGLAALATAKSGGANCLAFERPRLDAAGVPAAASTGGEPQLDWLSPSTVCVFPGANGKSVELRP